MKTPQPAVIGHALFDTRQERPEAIMLAASKCDMMAPVVAQMIEGCRASELLFVAVCAGGAHIDLLTGRYQHASDLDVLLGDAMSRLDGGQQPQRLLHESWRLLGIPPDGLLKIRMSGKMHHAPVYGIRRGFVTADGELLDDIHHLPLA